MFVQKASGAVKQRNEELVILILKLIIKIIMKVCNLASELKFVNKIGQTLSSEQRINIDLAVSKLQCEYHYEVFNFWGRVQGIHKNYYIVQGVTFQGQPYCPKKKHFWSSQDFKFAQLPDPRTDFIERVNKMDDYFTGQHQKILLKSFEDIMKLKNFTELDRLSVVVHQIDEECKIVPLGAYKMIPTHELILNPNFKGLKIDNSKNLDNYVHLRPPKLCDKKLLIESGKAFECDNFFDPISQDAVKKGWSLQTDESRTEITLRNLVWPGYVGYHRTNSNIFGGVYMGNGCRSQDLPFII